MAKKRRKKGKKKGNREAQKKKGIEAVGWGFWLICFVVLFGPFTYLGYVYSYSDRKGGLLPWLIGFGLAAFGAGLLSLVVNFMIQKRIESRRKHARKAR